jgi:cyclopropane-fatty-acyl-phospholipid synthase
MSLTHPLSSEAPRPAAPEAVEAFLVRNLARRFRGAPLRFVLGRHAAGAERPVATVRFSDAWALGGLLLDHESHFGDAFAEGRIEIEGDLVAALEGAYRAAVGRGPGLVAWLSLLARYSLRRSRLNVHRHYDLGNDFYSLWLDREKVYTCAYFESPETDLETAQVAKHEHVCRKLDLSPGQRVVEAGCGWGGLALHMARHHGVQVTACNVSREQIAFARARAAAEGLDDRVHFVETDYRQLGGRYDAFVSVGMLEHVGLRGFRDLARVIDRCLDPDRGRGLLHFIGRDWARPLNAWIRRRIFPGAYAPSLDQVVRGVLIPARLSVLDVENLRLHYALTLDHWRRRYEHAVATGQVGFDERFRRAWRLYLAGSQAAFSTGDLQLYQVSFARRGDDAIPWTRAELYAPARSHAAR